MHAFKIESNPAASPEAKNFIKELADHAFDDVTMRRILHGSRKSRSKSNASPRKVLETAFPDDEVEPLYEAARAFAYLCFLTHPEIAADLKRKKRPKELKAMRNSQAHTVIDRFRGDDHGFGGGAVAAA
ncbi:MAG: hypothetical protein WD767_17150 [Alphaproteobacteria bacterium]